MDTLLQEEIKNAIPLEEIKTEIPKKKNEPKKSQGVGKFKIWIVVGILLLVVIIGVVVFYFVRTKTIREEIATKEKCIERLSNDKEQLIAKMQQYKAELYNSEKRNAELTETVSNNVSKRGYKCKDVVANPSAKEGLLNNLKDSQKKKKQEAQEIMDQRLQETVNDRLEQTSTIEESDDMVVDVSENSFNKPLQNVESEDLDSIIDTI